MRVLHVLPSLDQMYGGPLRAVVDLSIHSREFGLESEILGLGPVRVPGCKLRQEAIHSLPLSAPKGKYRFSRELRPWLKNNLHRYDGAIIHGLWLYINWETHRACESTFTKYACFPHGMLDPWPVRGQGAIKKWKKMVYWHAREKRILDHAQSILFTTERERTLASSTFRLQNNQRVLVPFGIVDAGVEDPSLQQPYDLPAASKVALFLGRLHPKKNVHFLIDAWAKAAMPSNWHLVVAGPAEPQYLRSLEYLAQSASLANNIHFVGSVVGSQKVYLFRRSSWFLLPSKQENFGVAVLEAISHGCPVAISDQVYLADSLHPQSEIMPLQQETWIEFMQTRMQDDAWRSLICEKDREIVVPKFAIRNVAKAWAETLMDVFQGASTVHVSEGVGAGSN